MRRGLAEAGPGEDNWKLFAEPARITHDLTIVPSWTDYEATAGEKIIKLDPEHGLWDWDASSHQR